MSKTRLLAVSARVISRWMGLTAGQHTLLVCQTERNRFVVVPPTAGEESITEKNVSGINVTDAQEFPCVTQATLAAQHAADALQRKYITEALASETRH